MNYDGLINDISVGDIVLVDNGVMRLLVSGRKRETGFAAKFLLRARSVRAAISIFPGVRVNLPPLTEKDLDDVALGVELKVDFVALSFARQEAIWRSCGGSS